jgi:hypothetical protein
MIKYYTKAWQDECTRRLNADAAFEQEAKKLSGVFVFRVYDGPDGKDRTMHWTFKQGKLTETKYEAQPAPWQELRDTAYNNGWVMRSSCSYSMMAQLNRGEMTPMRALASPQYKLEGNKMTLMQLMKPLTMWNQICAGVETNYEFTQEEDAESADSAATQATADSATAEASAPQQE